MTATVAELLAAGEPTFSFEFFPPKTDEGEEQLLAAVRELEPLRPTFVDVTYGAGGSTQDRTLRVVERLARETEFTVVAHLTCVGATAEELQATVRRFRDAGVVNFLALRGDPPQGPRAAFETVPGGLRTAAELVALLREEPGVCVGVAAYPEGHPSSPDLDTDTKHLVAKCEAGADFAITQFFFDPAGYVGLVRRMRDLGCAVPVVPGIMPVTNLAQIERFAHLSGAAFPPDLAARLRALGDDPQAVRDAGVEVATDLARAVLDAGAPGVHLYTLNRSTATRRIHARLTTGAR